MVQAVEEAIQHAQEATPGVLLLLQEQLHRPRYLHKDGNLDLLVISGFVAMQQRLTATLAPNPLSVLV
jgi:hypothetical protein